MTDINLNETTDDGPGGLVTVGYCLAVLMPLIGFILGIVVVTRPQKNVNKHGTWIILTSVVVFVLIFVVLVAIGVSNQNACVNAGYTNC